MRRIVFAIAAVVAFLGLTQTTDVQVARAAPVCTSTSHCYAIVEGSFSPDATLISGNIRIKCVNTFGASPQFNTQELWVVGLGSGQWVEFGIVQGGPIAGGLGGTSTTPARWFWARYLNGTFQSFPVGSAPSFGTTYNATIKWTGTQWQFLQGGSQYGSGSAPAGPIPISQAGAETTNEFNQDSGAVTSLTRVQSGVQYFDWAGPTHRFNAPPFSSSKTTSSISFSIPGTAGSGGC